MELQLNERDARLYGKLFVSRNDIGFAQYCASELLKKGWHSLWWERRGTVYQQQAVYTSGPCDGLWTRLHKEPGMVEVTLRAIGDLP